MKKLLFAVFVAVLATSCSRPDMVYPQNNYNGAQQVEMNFVTYNTVSTPITWSGIMLAEPDEYGCGVVYFFWGENPLGKYINPIVTGNLLFRSQSGISVCGLTLGQIQDWRAGRRVVDVTYTVYKTGPFDPGYIKVSSVGGFR